MTLEKGKVYRISQRMHWIGITHTTVPSITRPMRVNQMVSRCITLSSGLLPENLK